MLAVQRSTTTTSDCQNQETRQAPVAIARTASLARLRLARLLRHGPCPLMWSTWGNFFTDQAELDFSAVLITLLRTAGLGVQLFRAAVVTTSTYSYACTPTRSPLCCSPPMLPCGLSSLRTLRYAPTANYCS